MSDKILAWQYMIKPPPYVPPPYMPPLEPVAASDGQIPIVKTVRDAWCVFTRKKDGYIKEFVTMEFVGYYSTREEAVKRWNAAMEVEV